MHVPPRILVLSGGGIRVVAQTGALQYLEKANLLSSVKEYVGVSAGGLLATCICIGYPIGTLRNVCTHLDFGIIRTLEPEDMFQAMETFGIDSGARLRKFIESILKQRGIPPETTFAGLRTYLPTVPILRLFASDLFTCKPKEFSEALTPNVPIATALLASMSIPGYFVPVKDPENGHLLVDGGAHHNFPLALLSKEEARFSLGITFSVDHASVTEITSLFHFFGQLYACIYLPRTLEIWDTYIERIIVIPCGDYPMWNFEASVEDREKMVLQGYNAAKSFVKKKPSVTLQRRYSVS
jgi:predicted acylesterase/phospholipase RssA